MPPDRPGQPIAVALIAAAALVLTAGIALVPEYCPGEPRTAEPSEPVEYSGRVVSRRTGEPIAGAKVVVEVAGASPVAYTDSEGLWRFPLETGADGSSARVRVTAAGFLPYDRQTTVAGGGRIEEIRLAPAGRPPVEPEPEPEAEAEPESEPEPQPPGPRERRQASGAGGGPGLGEPFELAPGESVVLPGIGTTLSLRLEPVGWRGDTVPRLTIAPAAGRVVVGDLIASTGRLGFTADGEDYLVDVQLLGAGGGSEGVRLTVRKKGDAR